LDASINGGFLTTIGGGVVGSKRAITIHNIDSFQEAGLAVMNLLAFGYNSFIVS
jgi:uncharacterized membrane protein